MPKVKKYPVRVSGNVVDLLEVRAMHILDNVKEPNDWARTWEGTETTTIRITKRELKSKLLHLTKTECRHLRDVIKHCPQYPLENVNYLSSRFDQNCQLALRKLYMTLDNIVEERG